MVKPLGERLALHESGPAEENDECALCGAITGNPHYDTDGGFVVCMACGDNIKIASLEQFKTQSVSDMTFILTGVLDHMRVMEQDKKAVTPHDPGLLLADVARLLHASEYRLVDIARGSDARSVEATAEYMVPTDPETGEDMEKDATFFVALTIEEADKLGLNEGSRVRVTNSNISRPNKSLKSE